MQVFFHCKIFSFAVSFSFFNKILWKKFSIDGSWSYELPQRNWHLFLMSTWSEEHIGGAYMESFSWLLWIVWQKPPLVILLISWNISHSHAFLSFLKMQCVHPNQMSLMQFICVQNCFMLVWGLLGFLCCWVYLRFMNNYSAVSLILWAGFG